MPDRRELESRTRYEPAEVEPRIVGRWLESGLFHPEPEDTAAENYSIAIPPPNVTGSLHMGHALNGAIQDVLVRHHRMRGQRTKWIFGTLEARVEAHQDLAQRREIRTVGGEADVEVERGPRGTVKHPGDSADDDEIHPARDQALEDLVRAQFSARRAGHAWLVQRAGQGCVETPGTP